MWTLYASTEVMWQLLNSVLGPIKYPNYAEAGSEDCVVQHTAYLPWLTYQSEYPDV